MIFLIDEDVVAAVGAFLAEAHDVRTVSGVLGEGTPDPDVVAYARAEGAVLVTADRALATGLRQTRKAPCLYLKNIAPVELERVISLLSVIESEHVQLGHRFWMQIGAALYVVYR